MKVRLLTSMASLTASYAAGDVLEVSKEEAAEWFAAGIAEPVQPSPAPTVRKTATAKKAPRNYKK